MECFQVRYDSRVVIYEHKLFIKLATDWVILLHFGQLFKAEIDHILGNLLKVSKNSFFK